MTKGKNILIEKKAQQLYQKIFVYQHKTYAEFCSLVEDLNGLDKLCKLVAFYEFVDLKIDIYHFDSATLISTYGESELPEYGDKSYFQIHLASDMELSDKVNKIYEHIPSIKKFKEVKNRVL